MTRRRAERQLRAGAAVVLALAVLLAGCSATPPATNAAQREALSLAQGAARALVRGDTVQARAQYTRALAAAESVEDFDLAGTMLLNLALVDAQAGEPVLAQSRVDRILDAPGHFGVQLQADAAARKALLDLDVPDLDAALHWADVAASKCAAPCALDAALSDIRAYVALERDDATAAAASAARAAAAAAAAAQPAEQANALRLLGRAQARLGQRDAAAASLAQALDIDRRLGLPERVALDLVHAADNESDRDRIDAARDFYERARTVYLAAGKKAAAQTLQGRLDALPARR